MVNPKYYKYTMPRLSLFRPNRTRDYQFLDRTISEMYTVGGLDIYVHKYMGPQAGGNDSALSGNFDATQPTYEAVDVLNIQDLLLLENRDRIYDPDVYVMRGVYNTQDVDFDLTQFGLFLNNDTIFMTFHYNDMIDTFGRKLMNGDVIEIPNLRDYHPLNQNIPRALPRYYQIQDADFASEGFLSNLVAALVACEVYPTEGSTRIQQHHRQAVCGRKHLGSWQFLSFRYHCQSRRQLLSSTGQCAC
jgi:hypothetical protein